MTGLGWRKEKVKENVAAEILDSCLISALESFKTSLVQELDVSDLPRRRVGDLVQKILKGELISPVGQVAWLRQLERAGRVEEFL